MSVVQDHLAPIASVKRSAAASGGADTSDDGSKRSTPLPELEPIGELQLPPPPDVAGVGDLIGGGGDQVSSTTTTHDSKKKKGGTRRNAWGNQSYADLITQAIQSTPDGRLTLSQVYDWMVHNIAHFRGKGDANSSAGWKVSALVNSHVAFSRATHSLSISAVGEANLRARASARVLSAAGA